MRKRYTRGKRSLLDKRKNNERLQQLAKENVYPPPTLTLPHSTTLPELPSTNSLLSFLGIPGMDGAILPPSSIYPCTTSYPAIHVSSSASSLPFTSCLPSSPANIPHNTNLFSSSSTILCESSTTSVSLPDEHWHALVLTNETQYCKIEKSPSGASRVIASVVLYHDNLWNVFIYDSKVPRTCPVLARFPDQIPPAQVTELVHTVHTSARCVGNPEEKFLSICMKRSGEVMRGERGHGIIVATIDKTQVTDTQGNSFSQSLRRTDCDILCDSERCRPCKTYRQTLRSTSSRQINETSDHTSSSSHTSYSHLTTTEKDARLSNVYHSLRLAKNHNRSLEAKIARLIENQSMELHDGDATDIAGLVADVSPVVENSYPMHAPQRIFWEQQVKYNNLKEKRQMRWHPLMIRFALNLKYLSTSAYKAMRQSKIINLPSERTLSDYTHWTSPHSGVQLDFIEDFSKMLDDVACGQRHCALSMDEMKLKSGLVFDKHNGILVGFTDLGSVNHDIECLVRGENITRQLADHAFVFLVRAIFKPSLSASIAHYFSLTLKGEKIFPLVWEVVEALELYNIPVVSLTSDGAKPNRRFYRMCQSKQRKLPFKTVNPFRESTDLFFFSDAPHLLKTARNCFSNSFSHSCTRKMQRNGQYISWKSIEHLYLSETTTNTLGVRIAHKLTRDHVWLTSFTRMRVYLAAQVMSESVATGLQMLTTRNSTRETRTFIRMIDAFFDCLNVKGPKIGERKRKDNALPYTSPSDERFKWLNENLLTYLNEWEEQCRTLPLSRKRQSKSCLSHETLEGIRITVKSFTELGPKLLQLEGVKYILSEVFSQDPLERYFSKQHHRGGSCDNPTVYQVPYNASTLQQQKSIYRDLKTMNVQPEVDQLDVVSEPLQKRPRKRALATVQL